MTFSTRALAASLTVLAGLLGACAPDHPAAPGALEAPALGIGTAPTSGIIGPEQPTIIYSPRDAAFTVVLHVNRGIYSAAVRGGAEWSIVPCGTVENHAGQRWDSDESVRLRLADLKVGIVGPDYVAVTLGMPWDGQDANGKPMVGDAVLHYHFHLLHAAKGVDNPDFRQVGPTLMGSLDLFLE